MIEILKDPQNWPAWFLFFVAFLLFFWNLLVNKDK